MPFTQFSSAARYLGSLLGQAPLTLAKGQKKPRETLPAERGSISAPSAFVPSSKLCYESSPPGVFALTTTRKDFSMRLVHSISMTLLVAMAASLSACSDEPPAPAGTGGTGGSAGSGAGTAGSGAGTAGSATGGSAGTTGGSAGAATGGSAGTGMVDYPTDSSQAGIEAFLAAASYLTPGMGWRPELTPSNGTSMPHLGVKRYFNETIIASKAAGNAPPGGPQHTTGSMAIKDILNGTTVIGKAAMLRTMTNWVFYCTSTEEGRCYAASPANTPYYAPMTGSCGCHGSGNIVSAAEIPAP
jgi:hypothetical protein